MNDKKQNERRWPHLIPEPPKDPPMEPVLFGPDKPGATDDTAGPAPVIVTDPQGSYTGVPVDGSTPVQDADDL
ncbi:MAG: hypothetical protein II363_04335 [Clostridia bacterium]|nr:hypothetical protein [Clostridia bacterium]